MFAGASAFAQFASVLLKIKTQFNAIKLTSGGNYGQQILVRIHHLYFDLYVQPLIPNLFVHTLDGSLFQLLIDDRERQQINDSFIPRWTPISTKPNTDHPHEANGWKCVSRTLNIRRSLLKTLREAEVRLRIKNFPVIMDLWFIVNAIVLIWLGPPPDCNYLVVRRVLLYFYREVSASSVSTNAAWKPCNNSGEHLWFVIYK